MPANPGDPAAAKPARPVHNSTPLSSDPDLDAVAWRAARDGSVAGLKMGAFTYAAHSLVRYMNWSPVYNGLTVQFKVFLHMAAIMAAGLTTAEHSLASQRTQGRIQSYAQYRSQAESRARQLDAATRDADEK